MHREKRWLIQWYPCSKWQSKDSISWDKFDTSPLPEVHTWSRLCESHRTRESCNPAVSAGGALGFPRSLLSFLPALPSPLPPFSTVLYSFFNVSHSLFPSFCNKTGDFTKGGRASFSFFFSPLQYICSPQVPPHFSWGKRFLVPVEMRVLLWSLCSLTRAQTPFWVHADFSQHTGSRSPAAPGLVGIEKQYITLIHLSSGAQRHCLLEHWPWSPFELRLQTFMYFAWSALVFLPSKEAALFSGSICPTISVHWTTDPAKVGYILSFLQEFWILIREAFMKNGK